MASRHFWSQLYRKIDDTVTSLVFTPSLNIKHKYLSLSQQLPFSQTNSNSRDDILRWKRVKTQGSATSGSRCGGWGVFEVKKWGQTRCGRRGWLRFALFAASRLICHAWSTVNTTPRPHRMPRCVMVSYSRRSKRHLSLRIMPMCDVDNGSKVSRLTPGNTLCQNILTCSRC